MPFVNTTAHETRMYSSIFASFLSSSTYLWSCQINATEHIFGQVFNLALSLLPDSLGPEPVFQVKSLRAPFLLPNAIRDQCYLLGSVPKVVEKGMAYPTL